MVLIFFIGLDTLVFPLTVGRSVDSFKSKHYQLIENVIQAMQCYQSPPSEVCTQFLGQTVAGHTPGQRESERSDQVEL